MNTKLKSVSIVIRKVINLVTIKLSPRYQATGEY